MRVVAVTGCSAGGSCRAGLSRALRASVDDRACASCAFGLGFGLPASRGRGHDSCLPNSAPCHSRRRDMLRRIVADALQLFERESSNPRLFRAGRHSKGRAPEKPGLYRLIRQDDGTVLYIGQTSNLAKRIRHHERHSFREFEWFAAWKAIVPCFTHDAYQLLLDMERTQIARHSPAGVSTAGGEGAPPRASIEKYARRIGRCRHPGECVRWSDRS